LFASEGASVVLADINVQGAERAASHITKLYPNARTLVMKTDVGKEADIKHLVENTVGRFGRLDVMVSIAE
jgi:NAD(P)-dependent dehydrogenase (short-subunit alcohol dehydrogenase family)